MILEAYLNAKYVQLESYEYIERDGVYQLPSEDETRLILREYLDIPYAKVCWSRHREHVFSWEDQKLRGYVDRLFSD